MPCRDGCNSVVYVCGCKKCGKIRAARKKAWEENEALAELLIPEYLKKARKAMGDLDSQLVFISDEEGRLEMEVMGEHGHWTGDLKQWLEQCRPFPETMTFERLDIKKAPVLYTTHKHAPETLQKSGSECEECPACAPD